MELSHSPDCVYDATESRQPNTFIPSMSMTEREANQPISTTDSFTPPSKPVLVGTIQTPEDGNLTVTLNHTHPSAVSERVKTEDEPMNINQTEVQAKQEAVTIGGQIKQETTTITTTATNTSTTNSTHTLSQLLSIKQEWEAFLTNTTTSTTASNDPHPHITRSLATLHSARSAMTTELLRDSGIGKVLNKLKKKVSGPASTHATQLLDAWKAIAQASVIAATNATAQTTPTAASIPGGSPTPIRAASTASSSALKSDTPIKTESDPRKRKADELYTTEEDISPSPPIKPEEPPQKRTGLAQTLLAGIEYPLPVKTDPTPQALAPSKASSNSSLFFAKTSPIASPKPPLTKAATPTSTRPYAAKSPYNEVDEFREKIRQSIQKCLTHDPPTTTAATNSSPSTSTDSTVNSSLFPSASVIRDTAIEIETAIFNLANNTGSGYRNKAREVAMNLKDPKNPELRERVFAYDITPHQLVTLPFTELASVALRAEREAAMKWEMQERRCDLQHNVTITDAWCCGKCKQRKCTYYQMQTRSADEPMTTFVRCTNCGNRWRC